MRWRLLFTAIVLVGCGKGAPPAPRSAPPVMPAPLALDPLPDAAPSSDARAEKLIAALADVSQEGVGYSGAYPGADFLPYPGTGRPAMMLLQQAPPVSSSL